MNKKIQARRDFVKNLIRNLVLAVLGLVSAILFTRNNNRQALDETCINSGLCSNCGRVKDCRLPQATDWQ